MKHLLLGLFFIGSFSAIAQDLHVSPNGATDSYIFVNDVELFVTDDIDLEKNAAGATEASIYLRNNAQLLQGNNAANSGDGFLSVYQNSRSDSFDYNFWSSPVGDNEVAGAPNSGNINYGALVLNQSTNGANTRETDATEAVINTTVMGYGSGLGDDGVALSISRRWIYKYENGATGYQRLNATNGVQPGYGFTMMGTNNTTGQTNIHEDPNNQKYDFRGRPNNGDIVITGYGSMDKVLSGNPYPSAIDLDAVYADNTSEINSFGFWDENRAINTHFHAGAKGGYATYNPVTMTGTVATFENYDSGGNIVTGGPATDSGMFTPSNIVPIAQGYMINTELGASGSITYQNSHRVYVATNTGVKSSSGQDVGGKNPNETDAIDILTWVEMNGDGNNDDGNNDDGNNDDGNNDDGNNDDGNNDDGNNDDGNNDDGNNDDGNNDDGNNDDGNNDGSSTSSNFTYARILAQFEGKGYRDMVLFIDDAFTDGHDPGVDSFHPSPSAPNEIMFPITGPDDIERDYVMEGISIPPNTRKYVPLTINVSDGNTQIKVKAIEENNLPSTVYFWDSETDNAQAITGDKEASITLAPNVYKGRFYLVVMKTDDRGKSFHQALNEELLAVNEEVQRSVNFYQNNRASQLEVTNPDSYDIKLANIFDMSGKLVVSRANIGEERNFELATNNLSDGIYLVKLTTADNVIIDYKITVQN